MDQQFFNYNNFPFNNFYQQISNRYFQQAPQQQFLPEFLNNLLRFNYNPSQCLYNLPALDEEIKDEEIIFVEQKPELGETPVYKENTRKCDQCDKIFTNKDYLEMHIVNKHRKQVKKQLINTKEFYCSDCKKYFSNKYFFKSHLSKFHGKKLINDDQNRIGLICNTQKPKTTNTTSPCNLTKVVCDICNRKICNKYFLKIHKQNIHGVYENQS